MDKADQNQTNSFLTRQGNYIRETQTRLVETHTHTPSQSSTILDRVETLGEDFQRINHGRFQRQLLVNLPKQKLLLTPQPPVRKTWSLVAFLEGNFLLLPV